LSIYLISLKLTIKEAGMSRKKFKIVITDCDHPSIDFEKEVFKQIDADLILENCKTEEDVIAVASDADGIVNQYAPITKKVIQALSKCKVISRYGVGVDTIDIEAATDKNIVVANVPDYCVDEVSTHAMSLILACARGLTILDRKVREKKWDFTIVKPLFRTEGQIVGLFGLGRIARKVAQKALGFGFNVIAYDPYVTEDERGIKLVDFDNLLRSADFISIHAPLTKETRHSFGENELRKMKKSAFLVNTSRGPLINENALYKALNGKWITGAALDVMEKEPPDWDNPLLSFENIIITPHISFYSEESYKELKTKVADSVLAVLKGNLPRSAVNPQVFKK
jgi:D-3-phosphoglycerate dehydrogenase / 2-oxoglutarate reductase